MLEEAFITPGSDLLNIHAFCLPPNVRLIQVRSFYTRGLLRSNHGPLLLAAEQHHRLSWR